MKKVLFSSLALCLIVSSCSNNDLLNSQMNSEDTPTAQIAIKDTPMLRKARAAAFVRQNPNLFGSNVMVFESYAELDTTLNRIQEMDYKELRTWTTENNVQNDILESNIIYGQEWDKAWEFWNAKIDRLDTTKFGSIGDLNHTFAPQIRIPDTGKPAISLEERAMDSFLSTMQKNYPQYLQEYDSLGEHYIEPLGALGEETLVNEKNLFLVGDEVHRFYKDGFVLCAMKDYEQIARYETKAEVMDYVATLQKNQQKAPQVSTGVNFSPRNFPVESGKYKMETGFAVGLIHSVWGTDMRFVDIWINNYHKTRKGNWISIPCWTNYNLVAQTTCNSQYTFNIKHKFFLGRWHCRHYKTVKNTGNNIKITSYDLYVSNQHELGIEKHNQ